MQRRIACTVMRGGTSRAHGAYPMTGAIGTAGAARIDGSIVQEMIPPGRRSSA